MNLLADWIPWAAAAVVVVALVGAGIATSRSPRSWVGALINILAVALASALVTVSSGLVLNYSFAWYPDLTDIFPAKGESVVRQHGASSVVFPGEVQRNDNRALAPLESGTAQEFTAEIPTSVGAQLWSATIVLPAGYFDAASQTQAYPVLYAAHGYPGSPKQWLGPLDLPAAAASLVSGKVVHPFILVIPETAPDGIDTECVYGPEGIDQMETWLAKDVPAWVAQHLRADSQPKSSAWIGFSAGGWCAAMMAMLHPDRFGAGISLGGYYQAVFEGAPPSEVVKDKRFDLVALAKTAPPSVALWLQTAKDDKLSYPATESFARAARSPLAVTVTTDASGGHSMAAWQPHLEQALSWLGRTLPGFSP